MNKLIQSLTLTVAAAATAIPAGAAQTTFIPSHAVTAPVALHPGTAASLNTQPIPPGHTLNLTNAIQAGSAFARTVGTNALNTQPIPPGHGTYSTQIGGSGAGGNGKHQKKHRGYDVTKNAKV